MPLTLDGSAGVTQPTWTTATRPSNPSAGQMGFNSTLGYPEWYSASDSTWYGFSQTRTYNVEYLIVAGGGGGGSDSDVGGGGGGGGLLSGNTTINTGISYSITVGAGGSRGSGPDSTGTGGGTNGTNGSNSSLSTFVAIGGGAGATRNTNGLAGGSGGGGGDGATSGGAGTAGQGNAGGNGGGSGFNQNSGNDSGGGGGAGGAANVWNPGPGFTSSITGSTVTYAAGGRGSQLISTKIDSASNTGDGGMGVRNGGSGVVILRYIGTPRGTGGTITQSSGYTIHTFTTSGTFTA